MATARMAVRSGRGTLSFSICDATMAAEDQAIYMSREQLQRAIQQAKKNMEKAVKEMDFLAAAKFRDEMLQLQIEIEKMQ